MRSLTRIAGAIVALGLAGAFSANAQNVQVSQAVQYDVSPPLSQLIQQALPPSAELEVPMPAQQTSSLHSIPMAAINSAGLVSANSETNTEPAANLAQQAQTGRAFQGIGLGLASVTTLSGTPPDPSGAVGDTQYVQWVNLSFAVFSKSTGAVMLGPAPGNTLFKGFGGPCETSNNGDPVVEFDKAAHRWVLSQFTNTSPYRECVAVSTTPDATGSYNRYAFSMDPEFADYPRMGVWPDGYYFSFNLFDNTGKFAGGRVCAFNRTAMLAGTQAGQECFNTGLGIAGIVPSDWDGPTPPPTGSPNYFLQFGETSSRQSALIVYKFHADFVTPANASFTSIGGFLVDKFVPACRETETKPLGQQVKLEDPDSNGKGCVPQKGVGQKLDEISDRMMYRAAYRNFGDHEALVATHTVNPIVGGTVIRGAAIRWYEIRGLSTSPILFQQGTFGPNPESNWRWMGSIGMDGAGDIAVGYSLSAAHLHPGIAFAGRTPADPAGQMGGETIILEGTGSQQNLNRWGDYSALSIDPNDDCTFWYTNEYIKVTGHAPNWSTWIASFKYPGCQ